MVVINENMSEKEAIITLFEFSASKKMSRSEEGKLFEENMDVLKSISQREHRKADDFFKIFK